MTDKIYTDADEIPISYSLKYGGVEQEFKFYGMRKETEYLYTPLYVSNYGEKLQMSELEELIKGELDE